MRSNYGLDIPFSSTDDYINEDNTSSWSMYTDQLRRLERLNYELKNLKNGVDTFKIDLEKYSAMTIDELSNMLKGNII